MVIVHRAECLPRTQLFGSQDVYVKATLLPEAAGAGVAPFARSKPVASVAAGDGATGESAVWRRDDDNRLALAAAAEDRKLVLEVYSRGVLQDELLGQREIELPDSLPAEAGGSKTWARLLATGATAAAAAAAGGGSAKDDAAPRVLYSLAQRGGAGGDGATGGRSRVSVAPQLLDATLAVVPLRATALRGVRLRR